MNASTPQFDKLKAWLPIWPEFILFLANGEYDRMAQIHAEFAEAGGAHSGTTVTILITFKRRV